MLNEFWSTFVVGDQAGLRDLMHDDIAFASPAFAEPTRGADVVAHVLATARGIYGNLQITHVLDDGSGGGALFFTAHLSAQPIQGVYRIDVTGGRIQRIDALFRPVAAAAVLVDVMMARLTGEVSS